MVQTANALKMSEKTVFTHKYMMMQKFNLRSDYELIVLLRRLMEKKSRPNLLRDYLENNYAQQIAWKRQRIAGRAAIAATRQCI